MRRICLLALALAACSRTFTPPSAPISRALQDNGTNCDFDGGGSTVCTSGACVDGFCCDHACAPSQICNAPASVGRCTDRQLGAACGTAGSACPTGFCVDGVCCESACDGICVSCNQQPSPGICSPVPDNTDPHHSCELGCYTCFGGGCGPATAGSDPRGDCDGGDAARTCNGLGTCLVVNGGSCGQDSECASDACVVGVCLSYASETLASGLDVHASEVFIEGLAVTAEGDDALLLNDVEGDPIDNNGDVRLLYRVPGGQWVPTVLYVYSGAEDFVPAVGRAVFVGRTPYVALFNQKSRCSGADACGLSLIALSPSGIPAGRETIDPDTRKLDTMSMYSDAQGNITLAYSDSRGFHVQVRSQNVWSVLGTVTAPSDYDPGSLDLGRLAGQPVILYSSGNGRAAKVVDPLTGNLLGAVSASDFHCTENLGYPYAARGSPADDTFRFTLSCVGQAGEDEQAAVASLSPESSGIQLAPLHIDPALAQMASELIALYQDGASPHAVYDLDQNVYFSAPDGTGAVVLGSGALSSVLDSIEVAVDQGGTPAVAWTDDSTAAEDCDSSDSCCSDDENPGDDCCNCHVPPIAATQTEVVLVRLSK